MKPWHSNIEIIIVQFRLNPVSVPLVFFLSRRGTNGPPPMSDDQIAKLTKKTYHKQNLETTDRTEGETPVGKALDEDEKCTICRDVFEEGTLLVVSPCKHQFHPDCIGPWLRTTATCPVCRYKLLPDADPQNKP